MEKDYLKEQITHERNIKDNLWLSFIATFGTSFALMLNSNNFIKIIFALFGFVISYIWFNGYLVKLSKIEKLLYKLQKGE